VLNECGGCGEREVEPDQLCFDDDNDGFPVEEDCDDSDGTRYPGATEYCDGRNNNCDDEVDEGCDYSGACTVAVPKQVDFGAIAWGEVVERRLTIQSCGDGLTVFFGMEGTAGFRVGGLDGPIELGTTDFDILFFGPEPGIYTGNLVIHSSDPERPFITVPLTVEQLSEE